MEQMEVVAPKKDLNTLLLRLLECPVCYKHLSLPILMCRNGHNICNNCLPKVPNCPLCKSCKPSYRNLFAEETYFNVRTKCENQMYGCNKSLYLVDYNSHLANCSFKFDCRIRYLDEYHKCDWVGDTKIALKNHVLKSHVGHHLDSCIAEINCKINKSRKLFFVRLVSAYKKLFWISVDYCPTCKVLACYATYVGSDLNAPTFRYSFEFTLTDPVGIVRIENQCRCLHSKSEPMRISEPLHLFEAITMKGEIECQLQILNNETNNNTARVTAVLV